MTGPTPAAVFTLQSLVDRFGGTCGGDLQRQVSGFAPLESARAHQLAFVTGARYRSEVATTLASAVLVTDKDAALLASHAARLWVCRDPYLQFARIAQFFEDARPNDRVAGIASSAVVAADAVIDPSAIIEAQAVIGAGATIGAQVRIAAGSKVGAGSRIGEGSLIHPAVTIYPDCTIGARCIVHSGAVIGADGFGFAKDGPHWVKIPQVGRVVIGDDVEIGANTTIDRGALDDTFIGNGVKLDNQIQIGHNVQVGDDTIMAAFVGIAGSAIIGKRCLIGGAARIMGHVTIVDDTVISTQTFVSRSITKAGQYTGYYPMAEHAAFEKSAAVLRRLDGLRDRVRGLEAAASTTSNNKTSEPSEPESPA
jgi:UDP-3-O-[3-hydroxymyristoyl] glucosamine N-acyltransferase